MTFSTSASLFAPAITLNDDLPSTATPHGHAPSTPPTPPTPPTESASRTFPKPSYLNAHCHSLQSRRVQLGVPSPSGSVSSIFHHGGHKACSLPCRNEARSMTVLRRSERRITRIATAIVWLFVFCHVWRVIPTMYEAVYRTTNFPYYIEQLLHVSHTLIVFNSAVNFLLYTLL